MAVYNCSGNTVNNTDDGKDTCVGAVEETCGCGCAGGASEQSAGVGNDLLILAAIVLLLIVLLR